MDPDVRRQILRQSRLGRARVFTDPLASPTGFPLKVAQIDETLSDTAIYRERTRICDLGYLRHLYRKPDGELGYRCPAEPIKDFVRKGGTAEQTEGRKCVCNGLPATVGLGQARSQSASEVPLVTAGDDLALLSNFLPADGDSFTAADVLRQLLGREANLPRSEDAGLVGAYAAVEQVNGCQHSSCSAVQPVGEARS
jgi:nitronate monooxygenase